MTDPLSAILSRWTDDVGEHLVELVATEIAPSRYTVDYETRRKARTIIAIIRERALSDIARLGEMVRSQQADARRYRYLIDHCSFSYSRTIDSPAERGIDWGWQQIRPGEDDMNIDELIDAEIDAADTPES